jgi:hypothetical protein
VRCGSGTKWFIAQQLYSLDTSFWRLPEKIRLKHNGKWAILSILFGQKLGFIWRYRCFTKDISHSNQSGSYSEMPQSGNEKIDEEWMIDPEWQHDLEVHEITHCSENGIMSIIMKLHFPLRCCGNRSRSDWECLRKCSDSRLREFLGLGSWFGSFCSLWDSRSRNTLDHLIAIPWEKAFRGNQDHSCYDHKVDVVVKEERMRDWRSLTPFHVKHRFPCLHSINKRSHFVRRGLCSTATSVIVLSFSCQAVQCAKLTSKSLIKTSPCY